MSDKTDRRTALLLAAIVALHFAVRLILFSDLQAGDDLVYSDHVQRLITGTGFSPSSNFACRIGFILALAGFRIVLGVNAFALAAFNLLCSAGTTIVAFALGRLLFNQGVGLLAAAAAAILPLNVVYSTDARPDVPAAFFLGLGLYFFLRARRKERTCDYVWSGVWLFAAYTIKEVAIFAAVVIGLWILAEKKCRKEYLWTAGAFVCGILLEGLVYLIWTGDFMRRFHVVQAEQGGYARDFAGTTGQILERAFLAESNLLFNPFSTAAAFVLFVPAVTVAVGVWAFLKRRNLPEFRELRTVFLWWLAVYLCLSFWPLKIYPYIPAMRLQVRMLEPLGLPMMLLFAYALWRISAWRPRLGSALCALCAVLFVSCCWILNRDARRQTEGAALAYARVREELGDTDRGPIYMDGRTRNLFLFWDGYKPRHEYLIYPNVAADQLPPGILVYNSTLIEMAREDHPIPEYLDKPSATWPVSASVLPERIRLRSLLTRTRTPPDEVRIYRIR